MSDWSARLDGLLADATPGPWLHVTLEDDGFRWEAVKDEAGHQVCDGEECFPPEIERANLALIAASRELVPLLANVAKAAEATTASTQAAELGAALAALRDWGNA